MGQNGAATAASQVWQQGTSTLSQFFVLWEGMRYNFFAMFAMFSAWMLWPPRRKWKNEAHYKLALSLSLLLVVLVLAHAWAALFKDYCLYCYSGYLAFFMPGGFVLAAAAFPSLTHAPGKLRQALVCGLVLLGSWGLGFGAEQTLDDWLLVLPVPRVRGMRLQGGATELWRLLANKFGWSYEMQQHLLPAAAGLLLGGLILLLAGFLLRAMRRRGRTLPALALVALGLFFALGLLLSPTPLMAGDKISALCTQDVIVSHGTVGAQLAAEIPAGSLVYWLNDVSPIPLLYLPAARVFPPQLNQWYTFRQGGDPDQLERRGYWNQALADRWLSKADFALIEEKYVSSFLKQTSGRYDELSPTSEVGACRSRSNIHVFRRVR
jgi:hypothetical protein